jgi:hypothetical protein
MINITAFAQANEKLMPLFENLKYSRKDIKTEGLHQSHGEGGNNSSVSFVGQTLSQWASYQKAVTITSGINQPLASLATIRDERKS